MPEKRGPETFHDPAYRAIYEALLKAGADSTVEDICAHLDEEAVAVVEELLAAGGTQLNPQRTIDDSLAKLHALDLGRDMSSIQRLVPLAGEAEKDVLIGKKYALQKERAETSNKSSSSTNQGGSE